MNDPLLSLASPRIGLLGGTFDPIHLAHLIVAQEVATQLHLDRILFIPANVPPHKLAAIRAGCKPEWQPCRPPSIITEATPDRLAPCW